MIFGWYLGRGWENGRLTYSNDTTTNMVDWWNRIILGNRVGGGMRRIPMVRIVCVLWNFAVVNMCRLRSFRAHTGHIYICMRSCLSYYSVTQSRFGLFIRGSPLAFALSRAFCLEAEYFETSRWLVDRFIRLFCQLSSGRWNTTIGNGLIWLGITVATW